MTFESDLINGMRTTNGRNLQGDGCPRACPTVNVKLYQGAAMSGDDDFAYAYVAALEAEYPNDHEETSFGWIRLCRIQMRSLA